MWENGAPTVSLSVFLRAPYLNYTRMNLKTLILIVKAPIYIRPPETLGETSEQDCSAQDAKYNVHSRSHGVSQDDSK